MVTKLATKEATISKTESLVLMKNMIRISVSSICYIRDIFPPNCFKNKQYGSVDIHQLQGAKKEEDGKIVINHPDAFLLTQWLEQGVFMALELEYLNALTFAIYTKHPITFEDLLLETYEFKVSYQGSGPASINNVSLLSKETVKNQAAKFIRSLTEFTSTLDTLPADRWITLQLKYLDGTPDDYEPEYFKPSDGAITSLEKLPLVINIGNIKTPEVDMKVRYAGLDSLLFEDLCKVVVDSKLPPSKIENTILCGTNFNDALDNAMELNALRTDVDITSDLQRLEVMDSPFTTQNSPETVEAKVKTFVLRQKYVTIKACSTELMLKEPEIKKILAALQKDGIIKRKGKGYEVKQKTVTVISAPTVPEEIPSMEIPAVPTTVTDIIPFSTPDDTTKAPNHSSDIVSSAITTTTRKLVVPDAPRKFINRMHSTNIKSGNVVSGNSSPLSEEIEDSFQDDIHDLHSAAGSMVGKQHIGNAQKRSLVLKPSSNKVTPAQHERSLIHGIDSISEPATATAALNHKRAAKESSYLSLSQSSEAASDCCRKRPKKYSVIRDPIYQNVQHNQQ